MKVEIKTFFWFCFSAFIIYFVVYQSLFRGSNLQITHTSDKCMSIRYKNDSFSKENKENVISTLMGIIMTQKLRLDSLEELVLNRLKGLNPEKLLPKGLLNETIKQELDERLENVTEPKTILFWYKPWGDRMNKILDQSCGGCIITDNQKAITLPNVGAVVFHFSELERSTLPTSKRDPNHLYAFKTMESSDFLMNAIKKNFRLYSNYFNITISYRLDSEIVNSYGDMVKILTELKRKFAHTDDVGIVETIARKKKLAVWIVSNCGLTIGAKNRVKIIDQIVQAGLDIDRRGGCFPDRPPPPGNRRNRGNGEQTRFMESSKFYMAFENSYHCRDYITEKLYYNAFSVGAVPIVYGASRSDYERIVPPNSCIFVDDFDGDWRCLAEYINYLDGNDTAYGQYLAWRKMRIEDMPGYGRVSDPMCQLCRLISGINVKNVYGPHHKILDDQPLFGAPVRSRNIESLHDWIVEGEPKECLHPDPL